MRARAGPAAGARGGRALGLLALAWGLVLVAAPLVGGHPVALADLLAGEPTAVEIVFQLRLPRVLVGLLAGGALAISGVGLQTLLRNPLAEPYTLGVAGGAALGAVLVLQLGAATPVAGFPAVAGASFAGALAVSGLIVGLALSRYGRDVSGVLLAGIAISFSCSAFILFIQYLADFSRTFRMVRWMMGGVAVVGYREVLWLVPWTAAGVALLLAHRWELDLLLTGEEVAASRGVDLPRLRLVVLGTASLMVGALVAVTGPIGFVGLIVPHLLRRWVGHGHLVLVPAAALGGGVFLAACDLVARTVMAPAELPVGILTALLGGPFFLWLLIAGRSG